MIVRPVPRGDLAKRRTSALADYDCVRQHPEHWRARMFCRIGAAARSAVVMNGFSAGLRQETNRNTPPPLQSNVDPTFLRVTGRPHLNRAWDDGRRASG
jgi:hypothetical protein